MLEKKKLPDGFKSKNDATDFEQDAKMKRVLKFKRDIYKTYTTGKFFQENFLTLFILLC